MRWMLLVGAVALGGCHTAIHQAHVSDFGPYAPESHPGVLVAADAQQSVVLGLDVVRVDDRNKLRARSTDYVDAAWADLQRQCVGGDLTAITTQTSTRLGFMSWTHQIRLRGLCRLRLPPPAPDEGVGEAVDG